MPDTNKIQILDQTDSNNFSNTIRTQILKYSQYYSYSITYPFQIFSLVNIIPLECLCWGFNPYSFLTRTYVPKVEERNAIYTIESNSLLCQLLLILL